MKEYTGFWSLSVVLCSCKTTRFDVLSCRIGAFIIIIIIIIIIVCKQAEASAFVA